METMRTHATSTMTITTMMMPTTDKALKEIPEKLGI